ncbi:MAG: zinc-binding dehydrogenase [Chloroflexi bacterium]|nr:zinc-binding dehydrogenase [Chloroflexota bacterium]
MRGVVYLEPGVLELRQVPVPAIGPDDILVRVRVALTCGTDVKTYRRGHPKIPPPTLFGHEFAGDVLAVGAAVREFEPGMRVVAGNSAPCNLCFYCKHGQQNLCDHLVINLGAFAEFVRVPGPIVRQNTYRIPDPLPYRHAALMEPLACVVHGQDLVRIRPGETVIVIGAGGPIGLMHLQLALRQGAAQVIAVDLQDERLAVAQQLGATCIVNPEREDPVAVARELTDGRGADVAIESAGAKAAWLTAVAAVRKGGRVLWFGGLPSGTQVEVDAVRVHYDELTLIGPYHLTPRDCFRALRLIEAGVIDADALVTHELPLERLEEALQMMMDGRCVKTAILPG